MEEKLKEFYNWILNRQQKLGGDPEKQAELNCIINKFEELGLDVVPQGWISVKDRLPDPGYVVLCFVDLRKKFSNDDDTFIISAYPYDEKGFDTHLKDYITYWMPLPKPPEKRIELNYDSLLSNYSLHLREMIKLWCYDENIRLVPEEIDNIIKDHYKTHKLHSVNECLPPKLITNGKEEPFSTLVLARVCNNLGYKNILETFYDYSINRWCTQGEKVESWIEIPLLNKYIKSTST